MRIIFMKNSGSDKERVAEEMPISEVRKCSKLLTPVNSLIGTIAPLCGGYMLVGYNFPMNFLFMNGKIKKKKELKQNLHFLEKEKGKIEGLPVL